MVPNPVETKVGFSAIKKWIYYHFLQIIRNQKNKDMKLEGHK